MKGCFHLGESVFATALIENQIDCQSNTTEFDGQVAAFLNRNRPARFEKGSE